MALMILTAAAAILFAELFGYCLHILLHSNKIEFLSRSHMQHHLREYHPSKPIRLDGVYLSSGAQRTNIAGIGMEWVVPIVSTVAAIHGIFYALSVPLRHQLVFTGAALIWSWILFAYMHDAMHFKFFWMQNAPAFLRRWFLQIRRYHDIHHYTFSADGVMTANFGICFFFFDRLFGTLVEKQGKLNRAGMRACEKRYAFIYN
ncbi:MAG: sterol desaturase family protein [Elusimicrobia bacterium]|nr:sterol desaturase family protein [Elusimicrobiota bacterium]